MTLGKTIQIYLPDGNPRGLKIAEITSRTIQAILIPRSYLDFAYSREELDNVGIYYLIGSTDTESKQQLYVGEAEPVIERLKDHNKNKDFWSFAIAIISKTQFFTKTHIKYLESLSISQAKKVDRFQLENKSLPSLPHILESMESDLLGNFDTVKLLVSTLGYPIFDEIKKPKREDILICKGKDAYAEGEYTEDGLIVFKGSKCNLKESNTAGSWVIGMRKKLIDSGILTLNGNVYKFESDHIFNSPSAAAATVLARRANGWIEWKYKNGKTLDEVKRKD